MSCWCASRGGEVARRGPRLRITGAVGAFAVNGGNLTELASSPTSLPAGAAPAGIVVT
jgi:hypothetical protein